MKHAAAVLGAVLGIGGLECGRPPELTQADGVIVAIEMLRASPAADLDGRRELVHRLEAAPADLPEAAAARDSCAKAYAALVAATSLGRQVRDALDAGVSPDREVAAALASADEQLHASEAAMPTCDRAAIELRKRIRR